MTEDMVLARACYAGVAVSRCVCEDVAVWREKTVLLVRPLDHEAMSRP